MRLFSPAGGRRARYACAAAAVLGAALALASCSEGPPGHRLENKPPTVWLSSAPPEGNDTSYRIHIYWGGWDPDGEISHYEYAITDNLSGVFDPADTVTTPERNPWHPVYCADSVFTFTADGLKDTLTTDMVTRFERSHTFVIRAVDEEGLASSEAAYRSFTAWTLSPRVTITVPRRAGQIRTPSRITPVATYQWVAEDFVSSMSERKEPDSVRWILHRVSTIDYPGALEYIRTHPHSKEWSDWHYYGARDGSGKSWTTPPTEFGNYMFAVQAKDEAGAVTPVFDEALNVRRVMVSRQLTGPILHVDNQFTGPIVTSVENTPTVILDMPAGVPMQFTWSASAETYGGLVTGYRYGWDITDVSDPEQWEVDYTPFTSDVARSRARTFYFGTHTFDVEVRDNSGYVSRVEVKVNVIEFSMDRNLLFVDDYNLDSRGIEYTKGAVPSDEEHDAFWRDVLENVSGFSWEDDAISAKSGEPVSILKLASYKSIVWDVWGGDPRSKFWDFVRFKLESSSGEGGAGKVQPNMVRLFLEAGGHLMVCGWRPMTQAKGYGHKFPIVFRYEVAGDQDGNYADQIQTRHAVGDESFAYHDVCLNVLDVAYSSFRYMRDNTNNGCGVDRIRTVDQVNDGMREALPIDPAFPRLEMRPEVAGYGRAYAPGNKGWNAEFYNPPYFDFCNFAETSMPRSCFEPIYGNGCLNSDSPVYNAPVAFWAGAYRYVVPDVPGGVAARSAVFGFEPYYFKPSQVREMIGAVLFDEWGLLRI